MKRIQIFKNSILTNQADFKTDQELQSWFEKEKANKSFGRNGRIYLVKDASELPKEEDLNDVLKIEKVDTPEGPKTRYIFKADYDVVISDISEDITDKFIRRKITEARDFGNSLIDDVAFINVKNKRSSDEIVKLIMDQEVQLLIHLLQTGSLASAAIAIKQFSNPMFTDQDKQMILDKITNFFNSFQV